jgi:hypothetical protein
MPRLEHQDRKLALSRDDPTRSLIWWVASRPSRLVLLTDARGSDCPTHKPGAARERHEWWVSVTL